MQKTIITIAQTGLPRGEIEVDIQVIGRYWTKEMLIDLLSTLNLGGGSGMKSR